MNTQAVADCLQALLRRSLRSCHFHLCLYQVTIAGVAVMTVHRMFSVFFFLELKLNFLLGFCSPCLFCFSLSDDGDG